MSIGHLRLTTFLLACFVTLPAWGETQPAPATEETEAPAESSDAKDETATEDSQEEPDNSETTPATESPQEEVATPKTEEATTPAEPTQPQPVSEPSKKPAPQTAAPSPQAEMSEPSSEESKTIAWVFAGITLASLAGGAYAGLEAQTQFDCLSDVLNCNESRETPIENEDYLKAKAELDRLVLQADMGYLTAVVTTTVTVAALVKAMRANKSADGANLTSMLSLPQE